MSLTKSLTFCVTLSLVARVARPQAVLPDAPAPASYSADNPFLSFSLEELLDMRLETGSSLELEAKKTPFTVSTITREQIKTSGARSLGELLEIFVPSFQLLPNRWAGDVWALRGVAPDINNKIIFLVNGVKLNHEGRFGNIAENTLGLMDDAERIEVLQGPAGLAYGSGAIAGVVNVITRAPEANTSELRLGGGSWLDLNLEGLTHRRFDSGLQVTLAAGYRQVNAPTAHRTRVYGQTQWPTDASPSPNGELTDANPFRTPGNLRASFDLKWNEVRVYGRVTRQQFTTGGLFIVDPWPEIEGPPPPTAPNRTVDGREVAYNDPLGRTDAQGQNRYLYTIDGITLLASHELPMGADTLTSELAFMGASTRTSIEARDGYTSSTLPEASRTGFVRSTMGERRYLGRLRYLMRRVQDLQLAVSAEYRIDDIGDDLFGKNAYFENDARPEIRPVIYQNAALFTEALYEPWQFLALSGGVRADRHTKTGVVVNPKLAAIVMPNEDHSIKLIFQTSSNNGQAYTYEPVGRDYDPDGNLLNTYTAPNIEPERAVSWELASLHRFLSSLTFAPSVSYSRISNLIVWNQSAFRAVNAGEYGALAVEGTLRYYRDADLDVGLLHAYQRPLSTSLTQDDNGFNTITDQITRDGKNFLNFATHATKLFVSYSPTSFLRLHTNMRVYWGLVGRTGLHEQDEALGENYLNIHDSPMVKLNLGANVTLPYDISLLMFAYNLLGTPTNIHAARWQQMATNEQRDIYTIDQRMFSATVEKRF